MISVKKNRTIILEKNGEYIEYAKVPGILHQNNLDDYAKKNKIKYSNIENIIETCGCIIFSNINDVALLGYMPEEITEEQLYQLELFSEFNLPEIEYMEVRKYNANKDEFTLDYDVSTRFSTEVIQSYYNKDPNIVSGKKIR